MISLMRSGTDLFSRAACIRNSCCCPGETEKRSGTRAESGDGASAFLTEGLPDALPIGLAGSGSVPWPLASSGASLAGCSTSVALVASAERRLRSSRSSGGQRLPALDDRGVIGLFVGHAAAPMAAIVAKISSASISPLTIALRTCSASPGIVPSAPPFIIMSCNTGRSTMIVLVRGIACSSI